MEQLKSHLSIYAKKLKRGDFLQTQDRYNEALDCYNEGLEALYSAKELCEFSDELKTMSKTDENFAKWFSNKQRSIVAQMDTLSKFIKEFRGSLEYAVRVQTTENSDTRHTRTSQRPSHRSPQSKERKRPPKNDNDTTVVNKNSVADDWQQLAKDSIKLLTYLRRRNKFGRGINKTIEELLDREYLLN